MHPTAVEFAWLQRWLARPSRREFLLMAGTGTAAACTSSWCTTRTQEPVPDGLFTREEHATIVTAIDRILPAGDGPSASAVGVDAFIAGQLKSTLRPLLRPFRATLKLLDLHSGARFRGNFSALAATQQDAVLTDLARGAIAGTELPQAQLFALLHRLTLEGFLSDPKHGGNRNEAGWRWIAFATPPRRMPGPVEHEHH